MDNLLGYETISIVRKLYFTLCTRKETIFNLKVRSAECLMLLNSLSNIIDLLNLLHEFVVFH